MVSGTILQLALMHEERDEVAEHRKDSTRMFRGGGRLENGEGERKGVRNHISL